MRVDEPDDHGQDPPGKGDGASGRQAESGVADTQKAPTQEAPTQEAAATEEATSAEAPTATQPAADTPSERHYSRGRSILVNVLIGVTTLLLIVAMFAIWANRLLFSPDNWASTSTQLLQNDNIRSSTANYIVDQLYANVNVSQLISSGLPPRLQPLAAPAAGALRNAAVTATDAALERPRIQNLWAQANRVALQTFVAVVKGGHGPVGTKSGVVTLDLASIVNNIAARLGLPSDIASKLPSNVATLTVLKSDQLKFVQNVGNGIQGLALWLTILVPLLYVLALVLSPGRRRRTLIKIGIAAILAGILVILGRGILRSQIPGSLTSDASLKPTIADVITISTTMLIEVAGACIIVGIPLILAGWFAGPNRFARSGREAIAPFLREHPAESYVITLAIMVLIFIWNPIPATGKPAGIIVFTILALVGMYVLRAQTAREFPEAQKGGATHKVRARVDAMRQQRSEHSRAARTASTGASSASVPDQLKQLAELRDTGAIDADEYQAAKSQLLRS